MISAAVVPEGIAYQLHPIAGTHLPTVPLVMAWLVWLLVGGISIAIARKPKLVPGGVQLVLESLIDYVCGLADDIVGKQAPNFYPLFMSLFFFLLIGNLIGLVPGFVSPTSDPALTFGLAILVFLYFNFVGIKKNGMGYFKQFLGPALPWYMFPVKGLLILTEVISFFLRPFSLGLRLFCNIFSKELFLAILAFLIIKFLADPALSGKIIALAPIFLRPFILLLGVIVSFIQALVFMVLSMSYIAGALEASEHH